MNKNINLPLTVIILTHRKDQLFLDSLDSANFASEIIILDNNSDNNWQKLKPKYHNLKIIAYPKVITDFASVRNNLIKQAQNQWVLFLDSDEILESQAADKILKVMNQSGIDAAYLKRADYFLGKKLNWGELHNNYKLRLAKKHEFTFWGSVHEIGQSSGNVVKTNILIRHYSHKSISSFIKKIINYADTVSDYQKTNYQIWEAVVEMLINPVGKFIYNFIFKLGFLDGWRGLVYATIMSLHSASVRIMLYEKLNPQKNK